MNSNTEIKSENQTEVKDIKYKDLNISFTKPDIWRRPARKKISEGRKYTEFDAEIKEFANFKKEAYKELATTFENNVNMSRDRNELNQRLDYLFEYFGKSVIPTNDLDPQFLLRKTNKNTLNKKLQPWCHNLAFNIPTVIENKPYRNLQGKFKDVPAFVVLAGPSLKHNREKLKQAKGKSLIIAVDTSLRPLLDVGVVPDIVVTHDANPNGLKFFLSGDHPHNKNNAQFNDLPAEQLAMVYAMLKHDDERKKYKYDTVGLFVNYCHPLTLLAFNGSQKAFYGVFDPALPVYDIMAGATNYKKDEKGNLVFEDKGRIIGGSSVGHVAAYIAVNMGCSPVSFLGLDLSYPGGQTYIEGASNQKDASKQKLVNMIDLSGNKVGTNLSMMSYKMVFEQALPRIILQTGVKFYNCTQNIDGKPAGILEIGAEPKDLEWVIRNKCIKKLEKNVKEVLNNA